MIAPSPNGFERERERDTHTHTHTFFLGDFKNKIWVIICVGSLLHKPPKNSTNTLVSFIIK